VGAVELDYRDCANLRAVAAGTQDALGCVMQIRRAGMDPCLGQ
jgi:hypothetical protein